jgi:hypothetical protein
MQVGFCSRQIVMQLLLVHDSLGRLEGAMLAYAISSYMLFSLCHSAAVVPKLCCPPAFVIPQICKS